jgi:hypothetical protein
VYKLRSSLFSGLLQPPAIFSLLGSNIPHSTLFSNILKLCSFVNMQNQVSHPYKIAGTIMVLCTKAVCKVRGLTLLLRVGTLWRCGDGLFFQVPPLASDDALLTSLHPHLENVLQTVVYFEISCLGAPFSWLKKHRNRMGRDLNWILPLAWKLWVGGTSLEHPPYRTYIGPWDFWYFQPWKGSSDARNSEVINGLQNVFEKWVERYKECIACRGRYFEKETVTAPPQSSDSE